MDRVSSARLRVVQCGTGNIGRRTLREVIRHPELELAGVQVYDAAKEGVDAGELCGEEPVGVVATRDGTAICAQSESKPAALRCRRFSIQVRFAAA